MRLIHETLFDLRFAARSFKRSPGFATVAFLTLVVGIAAVTSIFSYVDAVYFSALPYKDAERIVALNERRPVGFVSYSAVSLDAARLIRQASRSFERVSMYDERSGTVMFGTEPHGFRALAVDSAFIPLFDFRAEVGRLITLDEINAGLPAVMISDQLWRAQYGGDPSAIGKSISIGVRSYTIVGVLPPGFRFPYQTDAITGLGPASDSSAITHDRDYAMIGKLRPGVSRAAARAELRVLAPRLVALDPRAYAGARLEVRDEMLDRKATSFMPVPSLFLGAGLFVLLIACANVANLFLARAAERRSEMAIRASLGAGRWRLVRQTLGETLLLGALAALCGTALSAALVRLGLHFIPTAGFPSWFHVGIDLRVLAFAVGVTVLVTIAVGLLPALEGTRFDLVSALKSGGDGGVARSGVARASRRGIVVQLAFAVALFVSAARLVRSYQRIAQIDLGYPAERIAIAKPLFDPARYGAWSSRAQFADDIARSAAQLPGVSTVAIRGNFVELRSTSQPHAAARTLDDASRFDSRLIPDRDTSRAVRVRPFPSTTVVSDDYFSLLKLRMRVGRNFAPDDIAGSPAVTVVSASVAQKLWPSSNPVGHTIQVGSRGDALTIIGVVDDIRTLRGGSAGFTDTPVPTLYLSTRQALSAYPEILLTGRGDVLALRARLADLIRAADPSLILIRDLTLASQFDEAMLVTRVFGGLIGVFALSALALSIIGIYGVVAFGIAQRTREIGIRIALGGTPGDVMRVIVKEGLRFVTVGLAVGLLLAAGVGRLVKTFLYGVSPLDPIAYATVCLAFGAVAIVACWWPARRVTRIDPLIALRAD